MLNLNLIPLTHYKTHKKERKIGKDICLKNLTHIRGNLSLTEEIRFLIRH